MMRKEKTLTDLEFKALLRLHMSDDPTGLSTEEDEAIESLLNSEAVLREYVSWVEAFHGWRDVPWTGGSSGPGQVKVVSEDDLYEAIQSILPMASFGEDNEEQVIIYTGCEWVTRPDFEGLEILGPVTIQKPTPEKAYRVMVLNDGETFTDIGGCQVFDWYGDTDGEDIDEALQGVSPLDELKLVGEFDKDGLYHQVKTR